MCAQMFPSTEKVLVVIPVKDVPEWRYELADWWDVRDALVVNDGGAERGLQSFRCQHIPILPLRRNEGVSSAVRRGFEYGISKGYASFVTMDGDGQHDPRHLPVFRKVLSRGADFVAGNRLSFRDYDAMPNHKFAANAMASLLFEDHYGVFVPDVMCGYRGYSRAFLSEYFRFAAVSGFEIVTDALAFALDHGVRVERVDMPPIYFAEDLAPTKGGEAASFLSVVARHGIAADEIRDVLAGLNAGRLQRGDIEAGGFRFTIERTACGSFEVTCRQEEVRAYWRSKVAAIASSDGLV